MKRKFYSAALIGMLILTGCQSEDKNSDTDNKNENNEIVSTAEDGKETLETNTDYFSKLPGKLSDDEYIICADYNNQEIISGFTANASYRFHILSKEKLNDGDVSVDIDTNNAYTLLKSDSEKISGKFDNYVCMQYCDLDWARLGELERSTDEDDQSEFQNISIEIDSQYDELSDDEFPTFYDTAYSVEFKFSEDYNIEEINEVTINVCGKEYKENIGSIKFEDDTDSNLCDTGLSFGGAFKYGYPIFVDQNGYVDLGDEGLDVKDNVTIKNIKLINEDKNIQIEEADITYEVDGKSMDQEWTKGTDINLMKGDDVSIYLMLKDSSLINKACYAANYYIEIEYECNNKMYNCKTQYICFTKYDSQMLYCMFKDGINYLNYYYNYFD